MPRQLIRLGTLASALLLLAGCVLVNNDERCSECDTGLIRHVVLFQWKADTTPAKVAEIENAFRSLPKKIDVIADFFSPVSAGADFLRMTRAAGKSKNEVRKVTANPIVIIHPKSITGRMPLNTSEQKARMVVKAV